MKKIINKLIMSTGLLLFCASSQGQLLNTTVPDTTKRLLSAAESDPLSPPQIIPPSPNASALGKFGDIPPGGVTGIPSISVPIYSYAGPDEGLSLSVSLDYFAGGVRVDEVASNIGIGWALNAGGVISRTLRGGVHDDEHSYGFCDYKLPKNVSDGNQPGVFLFDMISHLNYDSQCDIFNFNFNGRSGKFILGKDNKLLIMSQDKLKIEKIKESANGGRITQFIITDEKGYRYIFADIETTANLKRNLGSSYVSSWYLSKIISPSGKNEISFTYGQTDLSYQVGRSEMETFSLGAGGSYMFPLHVVSTLTIEGRGKRLEKIVFPNNVTLECKYSTIPREDFMKDFVHPINGDYLLNKFVISDGISQRGFILEQDYSLNRATLKKVIPYAMDGNTQKTEGIYKFEYYDRLPDRLSSMQDHWGFYNDNPASSLLPKQKTVWSGQEELQFGTADRSTHSLRCLHGSLTKIYYPTGGYTEFEMEANRAIDKRLGSEIYAGGLRLKKMTNYTASGKVALVKEYEYLADNGVTTGVLGITPVYYDLVHYYMYYGAGPQVYIPTTPNFVITSSSSITPLCLVNGSPVTYSKITERVKNGSVSTGKTERYFRTFNGTTVASDFPYIPPVFLSWFYGQVDSVKYYDVNDLLLKKVQNKYTSFYNEWLQDPSNEEAFRSIVLAPVTFYYTENNNVHWGNPKYYIWNQFYPQEGRMELTSKTTTTYSAGNALTTTTSYTYSPSNRQVKTETTTNSEQEVITKEYNYPQDMVTQGKDPQGIYSGMIAKNMTGYIVETVTKNNNKQIELVRNNFYNPYTEVYTPKNIELQVGSNPIETRVEFSHNNVGRLLTASKKDDTKTVYLWGYNYQYPIAEIKNATYDEVKAALGYTLDSQIESLAAQISPDVNGANIGVKLRAYFEKKPGQVTTYTYKPLVGIASVTDPRGFTTYYEYDPFNRLKETYTKNASGAKQDVERYDYHYKNQ